MSVRRRLNLEWPIVLPAVALLVIGVVFIHSSTAERFPGLWKRQLLFAAAGMLCAAVVMRLGTRRLLDSAWELYGTLIVLLLIVPFMPGAASASSMRWIPMPFGFKLQPSEFMKLGLVLGLARHLRHRGVTNTWSSYLGPGALVVVPWLLIARQPDLGTALVLLPMSLAMVTVSGARVSHIFGVALVCLGLLVVAYHVPGVLKPYQKDRLDAFITSAPAKVAQVSSLRAKRDQDAVDEMEAELSEFKRGTGFQQYYSIVAIGSGGLTGAGLGQGLQNRANRLPVSHSDFVVSVVGEEAGLLGTGLVLLLHAALTAAVLGVAHRTREPFGRMVCVGVGALLGAQALMNMAIATGLLPVTGLTLPLVSYGGSSVLSTCASLGCVLDVARQRTAVFFEE
ncbi:MAG: hypothetical protein DRQ55_15610 [Planctomycetota bacterium]|nr:MAG: hypothetical protein DRQ55_15610 [Planctomycetota bacterium]